MAAPAWRTSASSSSLDSNIATMAETPLRSSGFSALALAYAGDDAWRGRFFDDFCSSVARRSSRRLNAPRETRTDGDSRMPAPFGVNEMSSITGAFAALGPAFAAPGISGENGQRSESGTEIAAGAVAISGGTLMSIRSTGGGAAAGGALLPRLRPTLADVGRAWFGPAPVDERVLRPWVGFSIGGAGFDDARVVRTGRFSLRAGAATGAPPKPHLRSGMGRTRAARGVAREEKIRKPGPSKSGHVIGSAHRPRARSDDSVRRPQAAEAQHQQQRAARQRAQHQQPAAARQRAGVAAQLSPKCSTTPPTSRHHHRQSAASAPACSSPSAPRS